MKDAVEMACKAHEGRMKLFGKYDLWNLRIEQDLAFCIVENGQCDETKDRLREKFGVKSF
jgi:hypothetical protein